MRGGETTGCSGFVGVKDDKGSVTIADSLYAPAALGDGEAEAGAGGATFVCNGSAGTNCYYTRALGDAQGTVPRNVSAGQNATALASPVGDATATYGVSGITAYAKGITCGDTFYYGSGDEVALTLGHGTMPEGRSVVYVPSAGTLAGANNPYTLTMPDEDVTINALAGYKVTTSSSNYGGSVTADKTVAAEGDTVTLTVTLTDGDEYGLGGLVAIYGEGQELELTQGTAEDANKWTFRMPDADVAVSAEFFEHFVREYGTYTINSAAGWDVFCDLLEENSKDFFTCETVRLGADIGTPQEPITRMAGGIDHEFSGNFDGDGHTLTVCFGSAESPVAESVVAPFRYVESGCTIEGLHVAGDIYTSEKYAGGLVGIQCGEVTIENCHISTTIHSQTRGVGFHGGILGYNGGPIKINGCLFDGKLLMEYHEDTARCGGFVGFRDSIVFITDSLYAPAALEGYEMEPVYDCVTFTRKGMTEISNCYYTRTLGDAQGKQAHAIIVGDRVTIDYGKANATYNVSGITAYAKGITCGGTFYAGEGDAVSITLGHGDAPEGHSGFIGYAASAGTLEGTQNPYTLTMPDTDVTVTATWAGGPTFMSHALLLSGQIGVNFYVDLSMLTPEEREAATMEFEVGGRTSADAYDPSCTNPSTHEYHGFTCFINSAQMFQTIIATLRYGEGHTVTASTSVGDYVAYIVGHPGAFGEKAVALAKAIADYGHYMTPFIREFGSGVGPDEPEIEGYTDYGEGSVVDDARAAVASKALSLADGAGILASPTYRLVLGSETTIKLYFRAAEGHAIDDAGQISVTDRDGAALKKAEVTQEEGRWCVRIPSINAAQLADRYTVTVTDGGGSGATATIGLSALSYAHTVMTSAQFGGENRAMTDCAMASLYYYYSATRDYVG